MRMIHGESLILGGRVMKKIFMVAMIGLGAVGFGFAACGGGGTICEDAGEIAACGATSSEGEGEVPEGYCEEGTLEHCSASCLIAAGDAYCDFDYTLTGDDAPDGQQDFLDCAADCSE